MTASFPFSDSIANTLTIYDSEAVQRIRADLGVVYTSLPKSAQELLDGVASCSPYLRRLMLRRKDALPKLFAEPLSRAVENATTLARSAAQQDDADIQMRVLRNAKDSAALSIALGDIAGAMSVMEAAEALSVFADAVVEGALASAVKRSPLESETGIAVLAMGKHGACELNYSSDIDLIVLFDPERMQITDRLEAQKHAVAVTRDLVNLLQMQTGDGYVFRTDLRLRPDPGFTAPAVSVRAAETYYEAYGQNWERMAYIKARPCAGDKEMGHAFLATLRPFVWRKYLDYAAIEDVHAVKRQMHSAKGGGEIAFEGHDIKLGRGGIREIEFYAQTQQLILGGKDEGLRQRQTLKALAALKTAEHISDDAWAILSSAYQHLRHVEHRLQMINDEQTHRLPVTEGDIQRVASFSGADSVGDFRRNLLKAFDSVAQNYDTLFEMSEAEESQPGPLVFTGVEGHPATLDTLSGMGFNRPQDVSAAIRRWHTGAMRATRTERARVLLTKLVPPLLTALAKANEPDEAFFAFEKFLSGLPSGVQVFSLLLNNIEVFDTLIRIMTISPYLGREFSKQLNLVESLLDQNWSAPLRDVNEYAKECDEIIAKAVSYEASLNAARRWAGEQKFPVTSRLAIGLIAHAEASAHYTAIANAAISALANAAAVEMEKMHGRINGDFVVIALGRLGSGEMTATSDVDLMFVYDAPSDAMSDGERSLGAVEYYTRLVRRVVTALSAATEEGALYEVDMQLRPSGKAGPAAVGLPAFRRYYEEDAWIWEVMALVKSRVIGPRNGLAIAIEDEIESILTRKRRRQEVAQAVMEMRERLATAKPGSGPWDIKNISGGLIDIAFLCQHLSLVTAFSLGRAPRPVGKAINWFAQAGELAQEETAMLQKAHALFEAVLQAGRAATGEVFSPEKAGEALCARMASVCGEESIDDAASVLIELQSKVARLFVAKLSQGCGR
ncbi:bifunctional [glutamine synthetase] adenylyltransferase/[glutamine synthetase]-adenylyl-L-tyrosine phosphorylase [Hyphococcus flavus]|uniref:Bifunctional [glutamine synthetase] adenylyltransferase/[glutamine synthetase]-adenylyl-L-tyrosine phosphorylase n=1 Tax=Hyphococcus flavus TaxID=1866326 RepID=A0AAE9ZJC4_9PROT|nr:bifunctional [glutamine synthetase] adenylyltransferase/[glutamine synthetase]-adenylyl-L-tyrosine phosphorylase [Hyphococcus flavus]WDI32136.1 bifunctional [glutamine synthetase] adenylyltransferase/[glutamine synthetase]-adenylyl-L-tyrosine phosphorylase [Hyphococcus flavus]